MARRKRPPIEDETPSTLGASVLEKLHNGTFFHVAEAYKANGQLDVAEELVRPLRRHAQLTVMARKVA